jgi:DNA-binding MarR family transcriptional regulator
VSAATRHQGSANHALDPNGQACLSLLVGHARARVLAAVKRASTTVEMATSLGIAPSTASAHLVNLHRAGILTRTRSGRSVHYALSPIGKSFLALFREAEATAHEDP